MAANKRKILEAARKHAQKGAKEKALKEYAKLLKLDPRDAKLRLEVGDAHRRWGQTEEAISTYHKVAEQFMKEGFDARAVAVYKQIQNLDPEDLSSYEPLAELYQRMGLTGEAIGALQTAADGYHKSGKKEEALGLLRKMATIDPTNTTSRLKVADLLQKEGMSDEAVVEYDEVAAELVQQGDSEGAAKVYERILDIEPGRVGTLTAYARNLIARGAAERAEALAKRALEADASPEQYELLAEVYRLEQRDEELVALYRSLAEVYRQRGDEEAARGILQRYVPSDDFSASDSPSEPNLGSPDSGVDGLPFGDESTLLDEDLLADDSLLVSDGDSGFGILDPGASQSQDLSESSSLSPQPNEMTRLMSNDLSEIDSDDVDLDQLLAEASVYLRYGKREQAIANLETILTQEPEHRGALEKLGEAHADGGNSAAAVEMWTRAVKLALDQGETAAADVLKTRLASLDEAAAAQIEVTVPTGIDDPDTEESSIPDDLIDPPTSELSADDLESEPEIALDDIEIDIEADSFGDDEGPGADLAADGTPGSDDAAAEAQTIAGPSASTSTAQQVTEDLEEADFYYQQGLMDEAETIYNRVLEVAPNHPHAMVRLGEIAAQRGDDPAAAASEAPVTADDFDLDASGDSVGAEAPFDIDDLDTRAPEAETDDAGDLDLGAADDAGDDSELAAADDSGFEIDVDVDLDLDLDDDLETDDTPTHEQPATRLLLDDAEAEGVASNTDEVTLDPAGGALDDVLDDEEPVAAQAPEESELDLDLDDDLEDEAAPEPQPEPEAVSLDAEPEAPPEREAHEPEETTGGDSSEVLEVTPPDDSGFDLGQAVGLSADGEGDAAPELGFDLAAELSDAFDDANGATSGGLSTSGTLGGTAEDGFAAVFAEFKKGVDATLSEGDHQAHYDLGIAYREMGLLGDAVTEFRRAMGDPERRVGCLHLIGLCALDQQQPEEAVGTFELALGEGSLSQDVEIAVRFDLGRAHEMAGELPAAREAYEAVVALDPDFADASARLEALDDPDKAEGVSGLDDAATGEYEMFEDLLEDDDPDDGTGELDVAADGGEAESYESFEDVIADAEEAEDESADDEPEPEAAEPETDAEPVEAVAPELDEEPEPEPEVVEPEPELAESEPEPAPRARKKKRISFV